MNAGKILFALLLASALAGAYYLSSRGPSAAVRSLARVQSRRTGFGAEGDTTLPNPHPIERGQAGLAIDNGGIYVDDWASWFRFAPQAFEDALADGARGADGITIHVMRRALPRLAWPPPPGSTLDAQWSRMVKTVSEALRLDPEPEPVRPFLNLVR